MTPQTPALAAKDIMTSRVITVRPEASVEEAVAIMLERRISGLPVVDDKGRLVGMITEGDLLRRREIGTERRHPRWLQFLLSPGRLADEYSHARSRKVADVMTRKIVTATEDTPLVQIVELMSRNAIKRLPVVLNGGPIGVVSRADVLRALSRGLADAGAAAGPRTDSEILAEIEAEFENAGCIPTALIDVTVRDGIVELHGAVMDERERNAIKVAVDSVAGVKAVRDHLAWVEPMSGVVIPSPEDQAGIKDGGRST